MLEATNFKPIEVEKLRLDPQNPRLPLKYRGKEEPEILNWMLADATLTDLMASIAENGFFQGEPIIVTREGENFIVVEGNRRLASVLLLRNPELATTLTTTVNNLALIAREGNNIPTQIWVCVVESREEVENYLAFRHISGVKQWPVISKARYLNELYKPDSNGDYPTYKELAKDIGSKSTYVRRLLIGYKAFEYIRQCNYFDIPNLDEETFDLTLITDAITMHARIADYLGIKLDQEPPLQDFIPERFEEVTRWAYEKQANGKTRIGDNRRLRILNQILSSPEATNAFINDHQSLDDSVLLTDDAIKNIEVYINAARLYINNANEMLRKSWKRDALANVDSIAKYIEDLSKSISELEEQVKEIRNAD